MSSTSGDGSDWLHPKQSLKLVVSWQLIFCLIFGSLLLSVSQPLGISSPAQASSPQGSVKPGNCQVQNTHYPKSGSGGGPGINPGRSQIADLKSERFQIPDSLLGYGEVFSIPQPKTETNSSPTYPVPPTVFMLGQGYLRGSTNSAVRAGSAIPGKNTDPSQAQTDHGENFSYDYNDGRRDSAISTTKKKYPIESTIKYNHHRPFNDEHNRSNSNSDTFWKNEYRMSLATSVNEINGQTVVGQTNPIVNDPLVKGVVYKLEPDKITPKKFVNPKTRNGLYGYQWLSKWTLHITHEIQYSFDYDLYKPSYFRRDRTWIDPNTLQQHTVYEHTIRYSWERSGTAAVTKKLDTKVRGQILHCSYALVANPPVCTVRPRDWTKLDRFKNFDTIADPEKKKFRVETRTRADGKRFEIFPLGLSDYYSDLELENKNSFILQPLSDTTKIDDLSADDKTTANNNASEATIKAYGIGGNKAQVKYYPGGQFYDPDKIIAPIDKIEADKALADIPHIDGLSTSNYQDKETVIKWSGQYQLSWQVEWKSQAKTKWPTYREINLAAATNPTWQGYEVFSIHECKDDNPQLPPLLNPLGGHNNLLDVYGSAKPLLCTLDRVHLNIGHEGTNNKVEKFRVTLTNPNFVNVNLTRADWEAAAQRYSPPNPKVPLAWQPGTGIPVLRGHYKGEGTNHNGTKLTEPIYFQVPARTSFTYNGGTIGIVSGSTKNWIPGSYNAAWIFTAERGIEKWWNKETDIGWHTDIRHTHQKAPGHWWDGPEEFIGPYDNEKSWSVKCSVDRDLCEEPCGSKPEVGFEAAGCQLEDFNGLYVTKLSWEDEGFSQNNKLNVALEKKTTDSKGNVVWKLVMNRGMDQIGSHPELYTDIFSNPKVPLGSEYRLTFNGYYDSGGNIIGLPNGKTYSDAHFKHRLAGGINQMNIYDYDKGAWGGWIDCNEPPPTKGFNAYLDEGCNLIVTKLIYDGLDASTHRVKLQGLSTNSTTWEIRAHKDMKEIGPIAPDKYFRKFKEILSQIDYSLNNPNPSIMSEYRLFWDSYHPASNPTVLTSLPKNYSEADAWFQYEKTIKDGIIYHRMRTKDSSGGTWKPWKDCEVRGGECPWVCNAPILKTFFGGIANGGHFSRSDKIGGGCSNDTNVWYHPQRNRQSIYGHYGYIDKPGLHKVKGTASQLGLYSQGSIWSSYSDSQASSGASDPDDPDLHNLSFANQPPGVIQIHKVIKYMIDFKKLPPETSARQIPFSHQLGGNFRSDWRCLPNRYHPPDGSPDTGNSLDLSTLTNPKTNVVYYKPQQSQQSTTPVPLEITGGTNLTGIKATVFVDGDLLIKENIINDNGLNKHFDFHSLGHITLIAKGDINIAPNVTRIDAVLVAQPGGIKNGTTVGGVINFCFYDRFNNFTRGSVYHYSTCNKQIRVNGSLIAQRILFNRIYKTLANEPARADLSNSQAAEIISLSPDLLVGVPLLDFSLDWKNSADAVFELAPAF